MSKLVPKLRFKEFSGEWEEKKLIELGILISGLTYSPNDVRNNGLLVLRSSNIQNSKICLDDRVYVRTNIKGANLSKTNDILICVRNGSKKLIGKNALIPKNMPLCTHGAFMTVFRSETPIFVHQLFQTSSYWKQVEADLGATINSINNNLLKKYTFYIPTPKEQQKIANTLSSLDSLIEAQQRKVEALKKHKKGLMQQLFPAEGANVPKFRFKEFSGEWEEKKLRDICDIYNGSTPKTTKSEYWNGEINWITPAEMGNNKYIYSSTRKITKKGLEKSNTKLLPINSIILSCRAPIGYVAINKEKMTFNQGCKGILTKNIYYEFLYYLLGLSKTRLENLGSGNTFKEISTNNLRNITLLLPQSPNEQQKIANTLSSLDNLIEAQQRKVEALKKHKKGLMQQMFVSGEG